MRTLRLLVAATLAAASLSAHAVGRLADLSIFDRATGRELPVHWHGGRAYVVGRPGNEYEITVKSRSGEDLLAIMSVDGVNVLSGQTASATHGGGYVVSPWSEARIRGWRKSLEETAAFYFTSLGDSYAARTGRPNDVGVIGVALYQRKRPPEPLAQADAANEPSPYRARREGATEKSQAGSLAPAAPLGTGHGRREHSPTRYVSFERSTEQPLETVAIYYDSYRNLVAQGVIAAPRGPRDPNPFPTGFVPDPR